MKPCLWLLDIGPYKSKSVNLTIMKIKVLLKKLQPGQKVYRFTTDEWLVYSGCFTVELIYNEMMYKSILQTIDFKTRNYLWDIFCAETRYDYYLYCLDQLGNSKKVNINELKLFDIEIEEI